MTSSQFSGRLALGIQPEALFGRFKKGMNGNETVGLGLAIVKQICDTGQLSIAYQFTQGFHNLSLRKAH